MQQIAQGMEHLSAEGIIHRDLAARNVLVMSFDEADALKTSVKITDYGLAAESHNRSHVTIATVELPIRYMSPEALKKGRFSQYSDVWACGVIFWCYSPNSLSLSRARSLSLARALSCSRALSCARVHSLVHSLMLTSLPFVPSESLSLSLLFLSLSHTRTHTNTHMRHTHRSVLSLSPPHLPLSPSLSHAHIYAQGNADSGRHSLLRIDI
jgi:serine/threonine protein kinase